MNEKVGVLNAPRARQQIALLRAEYKQDDASVIEHARILAVRRAAIDNFFDHMRNAVKAYDRDHEIAAAIGKDALDLQLFGPDFEDLGRFMIKCGESWVQGFSQELDDNEAAGHHEFELLTDEAKARKIEEEQKRRAARKDGLGEMLRQMFAKRNDGEPDSVDLGDIGGTGPDDEGPDSKKAS